ncbi:hypothetical protein RvY_12480 [Ramazzottius varieornatus]|uniref:Uncharacterized protein n=1 Tax=Ramazzottius varieornatus TaxID=947166 RepID=A0A1D1VLY5_RAMVA|nr:hypothetical protein RvY_12480 [Ramazzottius varieornatus]
MDATIDRRKGLLFDAGQRFIARWMSIGLALVGVGTTGFGVSLLLSDHTEFTFNAVNSLPTKGLYATAMSSIGIWLLTSGVIGAKDQAKSDGGLGMSFYSSPYCLPALALTSRFAVQLVSEDVRHADSRNANISADRIGPGSPSSNQVAEFGCSILQLTNVILRYMIPFTVVCAITLSRYFDNELERKEHSEYITVPEEKQLALFCSKCSWVVQFVAGLSLFLVVVYSLVHPPSTSTWAEKRFTCWTLVLSVGSMFPAAAAQSAQKTAALFSALLGATLGQYLCGIVLGDSYVLKMSQMCKDEHGLSLKTQEDAIFDTTQLEFLRTVAAILFVLYSTNSLLFRDILHAQKKAKSQGNVKTSPMLVIERAPGAQLLP